MAWTSMRWMRCREGWSGVTVARLGVKAVQLLEGDDVWVARAAGLWPDELLSSALSRSDTPLGLTVLDGRTQDLAAPGVLEQLVENPASAVINLCGAEVWQLDVWRRQETPVQARRAICGQLPSES
jgi:hypothetical protein